MKKKIFIEKLARSMGERISKRRKEKDLNQTGIAESLGIDRSTYSKIESGKITPTAAHIVQLKEILRVSSDWLLTGAGNPNPQTTLPDFREMTPIINRMLEHMAVNEALLHAVLSHYYAKKFEFSVCVPDKKNEEATKG